jgi:hypothetical protein
MPPKAAAAPVPESVLKKQAATKKTAEDRAKQQAVRKQVCPSPRFASLCFADSCFGLAALRSDEWFFAVLTLNRNSKRSARLSSNLPLST